MKLGDGDCPRYFRDAKKKGEESDEDRQAGQHGTPQLTRYGYVDTSPVDAEDWTFSATEVISTATCAPRLHREVSNF